MLNQNICLFKLKESFDELPLCIYKNDQKSLDNAACLCLSRAEDENGVVLNCMEKKEGELFWYLKSIRYSLIMNETYELECPLSDLGQQNISQIIDSNLYVQQNWDKFEKLTKRESEVLSRIGLGFKNKEVAQLLKISEETVKQHRKIIKQKLELKSLPELIYFAQSFGL